ncbi:hypothetical protein BKA70DRAFT_39347 [Coprinopsis sp. MPI-PUGE-AT-0042]|nr:hypothetical protein BKA70DRAFT_39347 [Coprinopsis sp. MPI-PUGE-AT-0042]
MSSESNSTINPPRPPCPPMSDYERDWYYHGTASGTPLLYRSDTLERPFVQPTGESPDHPVRTRHGVFNTPLKNAWPTLAPQVSGLIKARGIRWTTMIPSRFLVHASEEDERKGEDGTMGPVVIWISVNPRIVIEGPSLEDDEVAARELIHNASLDVLQFLKEKGFEDVTVEWYTGVVERL